MGYFKPDFNIKGGSWMNIRRISTLGVVIFFMVVTFVTASTPQQNEIGYDKSKAKLLSYIIAKQLVENHYSHKPINDSFSEDAFHLYIKQLDPQKRYFLQGDLDALKPYAKTLDDEMRSGQIIFPTVAEELLKQRAVQISSFLDEIETASIDFMANDFLEVDPEKLSFCKNTEELKARWRKTLKYQIISKYLDLIDINEAKEEAKTALNAPDEKDETNSTVVNTEAPDVPKKTDAELRKEANEKIVKSNRELVKRLLERDKMDVYDRYFSVVARAFDPHSSFMPPTQKEDFDIHMRGSLEGIGAVLQEDDGFIKVMRIIPGGAAFRQHQLNAGDIILMVAQGDEDPVDITDMKIRDAVRLIRGPKGSQVRLTVKSAEGKVSLITITRDVVELEETFVKSTTLTNSSNQKIAYLKIPTFYRDFLQTSMGGVGRNVTDDVKEALENINKVKTQGLIVDLRNNGGGALVDAVKIAGLFIKTGPIVQVKTSNNQAEILYDYDKDVYYDGPIVVLINRFSASASEILAGALQDYNRAIIVGSDHTYGKGTVQTLINLDTKLPFFGVNVSKYKPLGALKITTQKFYRINGESTQQKGVIPDIVLPDRFKYAETGEKYMENSMPWDTIEPITYDVWGKRFNLESLKKLSSNRVQNDKEFKLIEEEARESKKRLENTFVAIDLDSLKKDRDMIKKITLAEHGSAHGFGSLDSADEKDAPDLSKEGQQKLMVEKLREDPYVIESLSLLHDFTS